MSPASNASKETARPRRIRAPPAGELQQPSWGLLAYGVCRCLARSPVMRPNPTNPHATHTRTDTRDGLTQVTHQGNEGPSEQTLQVTSHRSRSHPEIASQIRSIAPPNSNPDQIVLPPPDRITPNHSVPKNRSLPLRHAPHQTPHRLTKSHPTNLRSSCIRQPEVVLVDTSTPCIGVHSRP